MSAFRHATLALQFSRLEARLVKELEAHDIESENCRNVDTVVDDVGPSVLQDVLVARLLRAELPPSEDGGHVTDTITFRHDENSTPHRRSTFNPV